MANIPDPQVIETWRAGRVAISRGWKVFLLSRDDSGGKIPFKHCARCDVNTGTPHDKESCECLFCHAFYAATDSSQRFRQMLEEKPDGFLAIRTGAASRLLVIDAEATAEPGEPSGLDVIDSWEAWTDGHSLPPTLTARSVSGGLHLYYRLPVGLELKGGTRVLPSVDVKGYGGYVGAVGSRKGNRQWLDTRMPLAEIPQEFISWYLNSNRRYGRSGWSGGGGGRGQGYDYRAFLADGCPGGHRDYFFNDLLFRERKRGKSKAQAVTLLRSAWEKCAQPPDARYEMPWEHVAYKLDRVWNEVDVPEPPSVTQRQWLASQMLTPPPSVSVRRTVLGRAIPRRLSVSDYLKAKTND